MLFKLGDSFSGAVSAVGGAQGAGSAAGGIGAMMSDERLKTNIEQVGVTPGGRNVYTWDWNADGERLFGGQSTLGVMAQENPDIAFTGPDGYLMVDCARIT
jgi:hypothetical protein